MGSMGQRAWVSRLGETWFAERERWVLWLPVAYGVGIAAYFSFPAEPPPFLGAIFALLLLGPLWCWRRRVGLALLLVPLLALSLGFSVAQLRTWSVAAPLLTAELGPVTLEGLLEAVEADGTAHRLIIRPERIERLRPEELPRRVRIRMQQPLPEAAEPGAAVRVLATLLPPPPPSLPGGYDFGREAWYRGLGAVGYSLGRLEVVETAAASGWTLWWAGLRQAVGQRVQAVLPDDRGAVANALLTGQRGAISKAVIEAYRLSGLAHLLAISGLHVSLIAGLIFFTLRGGLALVPWLALRYPIKKWAALAAMLAMPLYLWLVGAAVPAQRACLMVLVVLLAVLLDRRAISLRLVAWVAVAVLTLTPEVLLSASFQMSFGAVTALVAAYESWGRGRAKRAERAWLARLALYALGVLTSSLIAGLATAPFAAFHFDRVALYGLAANLVAVPVTAFWIMPWCLATYLALPLGLESWTLPMLGWGVAVINETATQVAAWPGASLPVPAMPVWGLALIVFGGLWLCLWGRAWRWAGVALILLGSLSPALVRPPDVLIAGDSKVIGLTAPDGRLWLSTRRAGRFLSDSWLERRAQGEVLVWTRDPAATAPWLRCDELGCLYAPGALSLALAYQAAALAEDCGAVGFVVSLVPARDLCPGQPMIDRFDLWREGTHALWLEAEEVRVQSVAGARGSRPWNPPRRGGQVVAVP